MKFHLAYGLERREGMKKKNLVRPVAMAMAVSLAFGSIPYNVMANDTAISIAASQGNYELNVYMPLIAYNFLQSVRLLSDALISFNKNCAVGIKPNMKKINENVNKSLMLVTALNPYIGYENAAKIAKKAHQEGTTLKEACLSLKLLTEEEFDKIVDPKKMVNLKR